MADNETITVPTADLGPVLDYCVKQVPNRPNAAPEYRDALDRLVQAWADRHAEAFREMITPEPEPDLPEGIFGRVELPGYRQHTGWITEEPRFGQQMAVVRNWDGAEVALAALGPGCQVVVLPTPRKRPDPPKALPAGRFADHDPDEDLDDDDEPDDNGSQYWR